MTLRTLNYGNYGIFLIMGNAGFCPSAAGSSVVPFCPLIFLLKAEYQEKRSPVFRGTLGNLVNTVDDINPALPS